jgi:hypothetical protein
VVAAPASAQEKAVQHATGTFEVTITPEAQVPAKSEGMPTSRMGLSKTFSGGLTGAAVGTMLAAGTPKPGEPAAYVAIDQFRGSVDGRAGGFLLLHRGTMTRGGDGELTVMVAPDTGTGALAGITGTLSIEVKDGKHLYDFAYSLPTAR